MKKSKTAIATSLLPQYQESAAIMERFLVAAHVDGGSIERSPNNEKIKLVDGTELSADALNYFTANKENFRAEFTEDLRGRLSHAEFQVFCEVVAKEWFDGKRLRQEGRSRRLKRSVYDYLRLITSSSAGPSQLVQSLDLPTDVEPLITAEGIAAILTVNDQMIHRHVEQWKQIHPNYDTLSNSDVFLRRGLALDQELDTNVPYREWDFINSYSIAFSAPEKFSQMMNGRKPAILNGDLAIFDGRMLFFSPFIPGMDVGQLEFGIIPSEKALPIHSQGIHGGILEYIIDPAPFQK
jgi:hypothetical protein